MRRFNKALFECLDHEHEDIACVLIKLGFSTEVYKQVKHAVDVDRSPLKDHACSGWVMHTVGGDTFCCVVVVETCDCE